MADSRVRLFYIGSYAYSVSFFFIWSAFCHLMVYCKGNYPHEVHPGWFFMRCPCDHVWGVCGRFSVGLLYSLLILNFKGVSLDIKCVNTFFRLKIQIEINMMLFCSGRETQTFGGQQKPTRMPSKSKDIKNESEKQFNRLSIFNDWKAIVCWPTRLD